MSFIKFLDTLEPDLTTFWASSTPINFAGQNNNFKTDDISEFLQVNILPVETARELFGSATPYESTAILQISINIRKGAGALYKATEYADTLYGHYLEKEIGDIVTFVPELNTYIEVGDFIALPLRIVCRLRH